MKSFFHISLTTGLAFLLPFLAGAQDHCLRGRVVEAESGNPVQDAHIWESVGETGTVTDSVGFFKICSERPGQSMIFVSHTTYKDTSVVIQMDSPDIAVIELRTKEFLADEVRITGRDGSYANKVVPGQSQLKSSELFNLPSVMGEADVVRGLQQMTGIQSVSEGIGGIYVRGGGPGQNRVALDDMELMNPVHLMGVYSVFNPLTTKRADVFKGHAPASVRSGLSSSILVTSKDPLLEESQINGALGNLAANLTFSWRSKNQKLGITAGFRRSYLELYRSVSSLFISEEDNYFKRSFYRFYDFNGKMAFKPWPNTRFLLTWYLGADDFSIDNDEIGYNAGTNYGNRAVAFKWNQRLGSGQSFSSTLSYSGAWSDFDGEIIDNDLWFKSWHERFSFKNQWLIEGSDHMVKFGADAYLYNTKPQDMELIMPDDTTQTEDRFKNAALSVFLEDTYDVTPDFSVYAGLRGFYYMVLGPYSYSASGRSISIDDGNWLEGDFYWSPSVSLSYTPDLNQEFRLAWSRNVQFMHLAALSSMPLPNDIWMMASPRLKPQKSHQFSIEYNRQWPSFSFTTGAFARWMENQLIFNVNVDGREMNFEDHFYHGKGRAYGLEFSLQKVRGDLQGALNYTLSRSERAFPEIFNGEWFNEKFDRTHDLSLQASYELNEKWTINANWIYATGNNMTLPSGRMWMMGTIMNDYDGYNNFRLPPYHRLDLSARLRLTSDVFKESVLDFSIVNVYNRANPYFVFYKVIRGDSNYDIDINIAQVSLFPVMPSVSWKFKF
ncbi:TonB-dependent receptor [Marinilabilia rubra]|uniref:TonB-dependent receptor n=2 Tax=Marinilabilia rubra TaxID=2162893 RepID=A0A2U2B8A7_9BACT|nr:TonB-dependent receptor [Marinilabilia rubra]